MFNKTTKKRGRKPKKKTDADKPKPPPKKEEGNLRVVRL